MNESKITEITEALEILNKKIQDKTWSDTQEPEFIDALSYAQNALVGMATQLYVMIEYFEQYSNAIRQVVYPKDSPENSSDNDDQYLRPTQTPTRARARDERDTRK